jgi:hypothetical protein
MDNKEEKFVYKMKEKIKSIENFIETKETQIQTSTQNKIPGLNNNSKEKENLIEKFKEIIQEIMIILYKDNLIKEKTKEEFDECLLYRLEVIKEKKYFSKEFSSKLYSNLIIKIITNNLIKFEKNEKEEYEIISSNETIKKEINFYFDNDCNSVIYFLIELRENIKISSMDENIEILEEFLNYLFQKYDEIQNYLCLGYYFNEKFQYDFEKKKIKQRETKLEEFEEEIKKYFPNEKYDKYRIINNETMTDMNKYYSKFFQKEIQTTKKRKLEEEFPEKYKEKVKKQISIISNNKSEIEEIFENNESIKQLTILEYEYMIKKSIKNEHFLQYYNQFDKEEKSKNKQIVMDYTYNKILHMIKTNQMSDYEEIYNNLLNMLNYGIPSDDMENMIFEEYMNMNLFTFIKNYFNLLIIKSNEMLITKKEKGEDKTEWEISEIERVERRIRKYNNFIFLYNFTNEIEKNFLEKGNEMNNVKNNNYEIFFNFYNLIKEEFYMNYLLNTKNLNILIYCTNFLSLFYYLKNEDYFTQNNCSFRKLINLIFNETFLNSVLPIDSFKS